MDTMQVTLAYGSTRYKAGLAPGTRVLDIAEPPRRFSPEMFRDRLRAQLGRAPLDLRETVVVVADKTRLCGYPEALPVLVETLRGHGLREERLRFIIAYGTHPRQGEEESLACYGEIYRRHRFLHHDCGEDGLFVDCGRTSRGVPIRLRRDIAAATAVITVGPICHHYFAGYGGGRKLIFPGCGERAAIYANHGLYLDRANGRLEPACQPGILAGNPLAQDLFEIAAAREADLAVHGIMDSHGRLCDVVVGSGRSSHLEACRIHAGLCETEAAAAATVVASCGGYPKDINFIQSHKAIHNAAMFVEDGGTLIVFSECRDGLGSTTFLPWYGEGGFAPAFARLCRDYQGNGGTALAMMSKTARIRIAMVTDLADEICAAIGVEKWPAERALAHLAGLDSRVTAITNASLLVRRQTPAFSGATAG